MNKQYLLLGSTFSIWFVVNLLTGGAKVAFDWVTIDLISGKENPIFLVTFSVAIFTFSYSFFRFRVNLSFELPKAALFAASTPFAFAGCFEAVWQNLFLFEDKPMFHTDVAGEILMASWIALGLTSVMWWRATRKSYVVAVFIIAALGAWLAIGYPQIWNGNPLAVGLNAITKFLFGLLFIVLLYDGTRFKSLR